MPDILVVRGEYVLTATFHYVRKQSPLEEGRVDYYPRFNVTPSVWRRLSYATYPKNSVGVC
jgi:hypothetical protein